MQKIRHLPSHTAVESERRRREAKDLEGSFRKFVEAFWDVVEPGAPFLGGMHVDAICNHLQACYERKIKKLLVNVPPRTGKSTIISVLFPAWVWAKNPTEKFLFGSYALQLATRDSLRTRRVIESERYQALWPHVVLRDDQNMKTSFENTATGQRQVVAVNSATTGLGGTFLIMDDPHNVQKSESAIVREAAVTWFRESWATRANGPDTVRIVVMQRVHQMDVSGYCLEEGGWVHLKLPMEFEASGLASVGGAAATTNGAPNPLGWQDPRTEDGELLWPLRYDRSEIEALKKTLGSVGTASQLQQRPVPRGGGAFKREWCKFWYDEDRGIPEPVVIQKQDGEYIEAEQRPLPKLDFGSAVQSWDLAFKGDENNDFVVGQVWARGLKTPADHFLLHQDRGQYEFPATVAAMRAMAARFPDVMAKLVEEKANGAAAIQTLKKEIPGMIAIDPEGGKISRAAGVAPMFEAGNIWLPHPDQYPWVNAFLDEISLFPRGKNDDQVDAMTQALIRMQERQPDDIDPTIFDQGYRTSPWG